MSNYFFFGAVGAFSYGFHKLNKYLNSYPVSYLSTSKRKWANIATSLVHASLVSILLCFSLYTENTLFSFDLRGQYSPITLIIVLLSMGYFVFDTLDICLSKDLQRIYLFIHHFVIVLAFFISLWLGQYIAFCAYGLLLEINSVFLHTRQLLLYSGVSKSSKIFLVTASLNIATFIMFRFIALSWLTYWIYLNDDIQVGLRYLGYSGLVLLNFINLGLLRRLLVSDGKFFFSSQQQLAKETDARGVFD